MDTPPNLRRRLLALGAGLAAAPVVAQTTDDYPSRPVRLVVSYAAGNITDGLARLVAQQLAEPLGQPVVVENRPGQGGSLGAQLVAKAPPDGYTLVFSAMAALAINPHVYSRLGYDPIADFAPVTGVAQTGSGVMYVNPSLEARTFAELVALSRRRPGTLYYGTAGNGTVPHLNMEALKQLTGLDATHVPYKAAMAVLNDVAGGQIQMAQESAGVVLPQVRAGKIRPIAVTGPERYPALPELPPLTELVPGYDPVRPWLGILVPAGTPPARLEKLRAALATVLAQPQTRERIERLDLQLTNLPPDAFAATIRRDHERLGKLVKALGLKTD